MKVSFKTGSEANYGSTNGELFFASNTKQIMLNGIKYIPKKLSELTNDSGFLTSITKSMVEGVLTGNITSHTHSYLPLTGGTLTGNLTCNGSYITMSGGAGAKGYSGYFNNPKRSDRASYSHILGDGYAYGTNSISIGAAAYAGIRNTDSDSATYPYLHWQWMSCMKMQEITDAGNVNCYGAILTNAGGDKDTVKFNSICINDVCIAYDESRGASDEVNQFLSFTNTDTNYGRVVVYIADNKSGDSNERIFGGTTSYPRYISNVKIGDYVLGQGCVIRDIASRTINGVPVYRVAFYFWTKKLSATYDITKETTALVCTKVNNANYSGASSYASGYSSVASGYYSVASGSYSVASGSYSVASGQYSVASGYYSVASGNSSVASGSFSVASGPYSVASGSFSVAKHEGSKVYALRGISGANYQTVLGRDNVETTGAVVVGWGTSDAARKNIFVLDTSGNATFGSGGAASVTAATFNGSLNGNAANASKLATARKITIGSTYKSFDGSGDIEFTLGNIITQSDTINVGTLNVASNATINGALTVGGDISGELSNKLSITLGSTTTIYDNTDNKSINITPSAIGAAAASHTHSYLPLSGGTMSNTSLVTNLNADLLDGYHAEVMVKSDIDNTDDLTKLTRRAYFKTAYISGQGDFCSLVVPTWTGNKAENYYITELRFVNNNINPQIRTYSQNNGTSSWEKLALLTDNVASASKWSSPRTITLTGSVTGSVSIDGSANVSLATTTNHTHSEYLPLTGGTLNGALTVPTLTSTGGILLGDSSLSAMVGSVGIQRHDETGFIGFLKDFNLGNSFNGIVLGWDGNYQLSTNSVRIDASTFTYKGYSVLHSGNLGYTSSGLSRAVQKDTNGNLYIVAPSLFEQGISTNYPKDLRWSNEAEGQLVYDKEIDAGNFDIVEIGIPLANGTSKGFLKSTSTIANVTGYTPCPVVSGTPYYKLDAIELDYTDFLEIGSGAIESNLPITIKVQEGGSLEYLFGYTVDNIPRLLTISAGNFSKYFFWLQQTDDESPIVAYYHCQFNNLWLVIDSPNMEVRISQGSF